VVCVVSVVVVVVGGAAGGVAGVSTFGAGGFSASFLWQAASASAQRPTVIQRPVISFPPKAFVAQGAIQAQVLIEMDTFYESLAVDASSLSLWESGF